MTTVTQTSPIITTPIARAMAYAAYFLLLAALPTAGFGALMGLLIAYARRDGASPLIRSHHRFQIRIFWIGLALAVAALALLVGAWMSAWREPLPYHPFQASPSPDAQTVAFHPAAAPLLQPAAFHGFSYSWGDPALSRRSVWEGYGAMITIAVAGLWSLGAPLFGLVRLASERPMGHSAR